MQQIVELEPKAATSFFHPPELTCLQVGRKITVGVSTLEQSKLSPAQHPRCASHLGAVRSSVVSGC